MAVSFLDTSAIVKRYVLETGTAWIQALTDPAAGHVHCLARITKPETVAAISRRERGGHITPPDAVTVLRDFDQGFARQYLIVGMSDAVERYPLPPAPFDPPPSGHVANLMA